MTFDPAKVHPVWRYGGGFEIRAGEAPARPMALDDLRAHIAATRLVHGNEEADRLQAELDGLLAIKALCERDPRVRTGVGHVEADVR